MTNQELAYCCLNCTDQKNCCVACGECPGCCADCGDTSMCQSTAYFGKNNKIYKAYTATYFSWGTDYDWLKDKEISFGSINGTYNSIKNETLLYGSITYNSWSCGSCLCGHGPDIAYSLYTINYDGKTSTAVGSSRGLCRDCEECSSDYCFQCGCTCEKIFSGTSTDDGVPTIPIINASAPSCGMFKDEKHDSGGTVTFIIPLKTYNKSGEIVADPTPANAYDPCNPIRIASAPPCCFFAL